MSDFRDRFERQLVEAAERVLAPSPSSSPAPGQRRRSRLPRRGLLAAAVVVVLGGSAVATVTHPWSPELGDPQVHAPRPAIALDAPPAEQLRLLGVLRRPANASDHGPEVRAALRWLGPSTEGVRTDYVRRIDHGGGAAITLIPVERWDGYMGRGGFRNALCVFAADPSGDGGGSMCWSTTTLRQGYAVGGIGARVFGLAPDGVATVDIHFPGGRVEPVTVIDNFFDYERPPAEADGRSPTWTSITWRDARGAPVHRLSAWRTGARRGR